MVDLQRAFDCTREGRESQRAFENEPEQRAHVVHVDDGLVGVLERALGDPRLDVLLRGKLEHLVDHLRRADG